MIVGRAIERLRAIATPSTSAAAFDGLPAALEALMKLGERWNALREGAAAERLYAVLAPVYQRQFRNLSQTLEVDECYPVDPRDGA